MSSIKMQAAIARAPGENFSIEPVVLEAPREDEILVRIRGVGICHSDVLMRDSQMVPLPSVLGHEGRESLSVSANSSPKYRWAIASRSASVLVVCVKTAKKVSLPAAPNSSASISLDAGPTAHRRFRQTRDLFRATSLASPRLRPTR